MSHSGKFVIRIGASFHQRLSSEARRRSCSLNQVCIDLLEKGLERQAKEGENFPFLDSTIKKLRGQFGDALEGVVIFGSRVTGRAMNTSDLDLLVVLSSKIALTRSLYRWWDETISIPVSITVNPHFVHLPVSVEEAGGLWLEMAVGHRVIWEKKRVLSQVLAALKDRISRDDVRRYWSHGLPYWIRRENEEQRSDH